MFVSQGPVTVDELLEMGRAKLMNHDLALEMSRLSQTSETLAADKQVQVCTAFVRVFVSSSCPKVPVFVVVLSNHAASRAANHYSLMLLLRPLSMCCRASWQTKELEKRLSQESAEAKRCQAEVAELRGMLERERKEADEQRVGESKANASARQELDFASTTRVRLGVSCLWSILPTSGPLSLCPPLPWITGPFCVETF